MSGRKISIELTEKIWDEIWEAIDTVLEDSSTNEDVVEVLDSFQAVIENHLGSDAGFEPEVPEEDEPEDD